MEVINSIGRRKAAVARLFMSEGTGKIVINKREIENYFPSKHRLNCDNPGPE